jgi:3-oxoacyl-[acyl-carrier protein] reductase
MNNLKLNDNFQITREEVKNFVLLCGDKNSLHLDPIFSNRSNYKDCIVHGMLPILFLAKLRQKKGSPRLRIVKIAASFNHPVFVNDELTIQLEVKSQRLEFKISNKLSGVNVTNGYAICEKFDSPSSKSTSILKNIKPIVLGIQEESINKFEDIKVGQIEKVNLFIHKSHFSLLDRILNIQSTKESLIEETSLLLLSSISSLVGMKLPGQLATFINFKLEFNYLALLENSYTLQGKVSFKSQSTKVIKSRINLSDTKSKKKLVAGEVQTRINEPHKIMPTLNELNNNLDLGIKGKVALITGSSRGIGETSAKLLALHGALVVINYNKSEVEANSIVDEILNNGGKAIAIQADVSDIIQVSQMFSKVQSSFGDVDILVNNAVGSFQSISFESLTWDQIQKDIEVILKGAFNCSKEAIKSMKKKQSGKIINMTTTATDNPPKNQGKYIMAKSALVGFTRTLAAEYSGYNIQINMVSPSFVETDLTNNINELFKDKIKADSPSNRFAKPYEVANAVLFLSSSMSSFISGQKINVNGGQPPFS